MADKKGYDEPDPSSGGYDLPTAMDLANPLDNELRERLKRSPLKQTDVAKAIGRRQPWLNRWMHGSGHATVDDVVRILALLIGIERPPISDVERRVLKALQSVPEDVREDVASVMEAVAKGYPRATLPGSTLRNVDTTPATNLTARERLQVDGTATEGTTSTPPTMKKKTRRYGTGHR